MKSCHTPMNAVIVSAIVALGSLANFTQGQVVVGAGATAKLPITSITLYRSGVGYFERRGPINAGDSVQLRFANDEINDMLKSMVILDPEKALRSVSYDSKEPLARQLGSFGIDLSDNPTLGTILGRLRGTSVRFVTADGPVTGIILGSEMRDQAQGSAQKAIAVPFINVVTETGVRSVNLTTIVTVQLENPALNTELMKALGALAAHSTDRFKTVDIAFSGKGSRNVIVSYVNEMPTWKTSYRLLLPSETASTEKPLIQGWAIVENTTDDDWTSVNLALVASQPVSFQMDLSEPLHVARPILPVPMIAGAAPRIYQDGDAFKDKRELTQMASTAPSAPPPGRAMMAKRSMVGTDFDGAAGGGSLLGSGGDAAMMETGEMSAEERWKQTAISQAQAGSIGEAFQYTLQNPISIGRQQSAMLPILSSPIEGRRVSIYNQADGIDHPMRGVELTNSTGLQMIPGPIAVFDEFTYAGDAQIGFLTLGDKRLLAYAVDLSVAAAVQQETTNSVRSLKIVNGLIEQSIKVVSTRSYAFNNKDSVRSRRLLVEVAKERGWELTQPKKPTEETATLYRFEMNLKPDEKATLVVTQEMTTLQRIGVVGYDMPTLISFASEGKASPAVVDAVKKVAAMQASINGTSLRITRLQQEKQAIDADQNRVRQNMNAIDHDTDIYRRYLSKFSEQESRLETMREEESKEQKTMTIQQQELQAFVASLNVS